MIDITVEVREGLTVVEVRGHERSAEGEPGEHGRACAAVTAITNAALLGLQHAAESSFPSCITLTIKE